MISIVAARTKNWVIGSNDGMPWYLPADLRHFRELTVGGAVVMGRKTYESILAFRGRPLPDRINVVVTNNREYEAPGCVITHSLNEGLEAAENLEVFVIGGGMLFSLALPRADVINMTEIDVEIEGDVFFPQLQVDEWLEVSRIFRARDARNQYDLQFVRLHRV